MPDGILAEGVTLEGWVHTILCGWDPVAVYYWEEVKPLSLPVDHIAIGEPGGEPRY